MINHMIVIRKMHIRKLSLKNGNKNTNTRFLSGKELCRISLAQLYPTTSWCKSRENSGNVGRISVCIVLINERESSLFASYGAFCTSWGKVIVLIDYDQNFDW